MNIMEDNKPAYRSYIVFSSRSTAAEGGFFAVSRKLREKFEDSACAIENAPDSSSFLLVENKKPVTQAALSMLFSGYEFTQHTVDSLRQSGIASSTTCMEEPAAIFVAHPL